jgi:hypothetical protein
VSFRMPASGLGRIILLVVALVLLGGGVVGVVGLAREDPPGAVIFVLVMALSSGLTFYLYRAMGQGQVRVDSQGLTVEMRPLVRAFIPLEAIHTAQRLRRYIPGFGLNLGVHVGFGSGGSLDMVVGLGPGVELSLSRPCPARVLGLPLAVKKVRISLDEADFFLDYINSVREKKG